MAANYHTETPHILDYSKYPGMLPVAFWSIHYFIVSCDWLFSRGWFSWQTLRSVKDLLRRIWGPQVIDFFFFLYIYLHRLNDRCLVLFFLGKLLKFSISWHRWPISWFGTKMLYGLNLTKNIYIYISMYPCIPSFI